MSAEANANADQWQGICHKMRNKKYAVKAAA